MALMLDSPQTQKSSTLEPSRYAEEPASDVSTNLATALDPHEVPPQYLKDTFKRYCTLRNFDDPHIMDFSIIDSGDLDAVPGDRLEQSFLHFLAQTFVKTDLAQRLSPLAPYYECDEIPGLVVFPSLLPPEVQRELLSRLLHRDLSNPNHQTNLHLHYDISYPERGESFFSSSPSTVLFQPKDPKMHKPLSMERVLQKKLRWMTLGGQYDWTRKAYPVETPPDFPLDIADLIHSIFPFMDPQAAIVNLYSPGDTLSIHRDVSEEVDRGLVSISLGCDCLFIIGIENKSHPAGFQDKIIRLRSGDVLCMRDKARFAWHGVPKIIPGTCPEYLESWPSNQGSRCPNWADWVKNKRINLNVRQMRETP